jgi:hypothetical protein
MERKSRRYYFIPVFIIGAILILSLVVMLLWNAILPDLLNLQRIRYDQSLGLLILCKILFGSFRPGPPFGFGRGPHWRSKLMNLSPEEREKFKEEWRKRTFGQKADQ